jgi:hypothetical protein
MFKCLLEKSKCLFKKKKKDIVVESKEINDDNEIIIDLRKEHMSLHSSKEDINNATIHGWSARWRELQVGDKVRFFAKGHEGGSSYIITLNKNPRDPADMFMYECKFNPKQ